MMIDVVLHIVVGTLLAVLWIELGVLWSIFFDVTKAFVANLSKRKQLSQNRESIERANKE